MESFWASINEPVLRQGDLLPECWIPEFPDDFADNMQTALVIPADQADLIIITQSCDVEHGRLSLVAMCPVWSIPDFEAAQAAHGRGKSASPVASGVHCRRPVSGSICAPRAIESLSSE